MTEIRTDPLRDDARPAEERITTEGPVYTVTGGDWDTITGSVDPLSNEKIVVNMGPQHPSTHGVLRLVLELEGETVTEVRPVIGYLHTGIEKNLEYRNWTQGTTFVTRADYLAPLFNEAGYCLAVEKLLGITDQITERAWVTVSPSSSSTSRSTPCVEGCCGPMLTTIRSSCSAKSTLSRSVSQSPPVTV